MPSSSPPTWLPSQGESEASPTGVPQTSPNSASVFSRGCYFLPEEVKRDLNTKWGFAPRRKNIWELCSEWGHRTPWFALTPWGFSPEQVVHSLLHLREGNSWGGGENQVHTTLLRV